MVSDIDYFWKKLSLTENQFKVFLVLDKYKNKEVKRWDLLYELGWDSMKKGLLSKIINKFVREGIFKVNYRYNKGVYLEIVPLYESYKVFDSGNKKEVWVKIKKG